MKMKKANPIAYNKSIWLMCQKEDKTFEIKPYDFVASDRNKDENIRSYASRYAVKGKQILDNVIKGVF